MAVVVPGGGEVIRNRLRQLPQPHYNTTTTTRLLLVAGDFPECRLHGVYKLGSLRMSIASCFAVTFDGLLGSCGDQSPIEIDLNLPVHSLLWVYYRGLAGLGSLITLLFS